MKRNFQLSLFLVLFFSINLALAASSNQATLCQQLQEKIQTVSNNIAAIYEADSNIYTEFSNVLTIDELPDESYDVQVALQNNFKLVQKTQIELQNFIV